MSDAIVSLSSEMNRTEFHNQQHSTNILGFCLLWVCPVCWLAPLCCVQAKDRSWRLHSRVEVGKSCCARLVVAGPRLAVVWQAQYTEPPGGAAARVVTTGPRLAVVWQVQYTEPPRGRRWPAAGHSTGCVAGAVHRASWRSWSPLACGWLSCGRRSTQSLLEELLRAWSPLARGLLSCGRRSTQSFLLLYSGCCGCFFVPLSCGCCGCFSKIGSRHAQSNEWRIFHLSLDDLIRLKDFHTADSHLTAFMRLMRLITSYGR